MQCLQPFAGTFLGWALLGEGISWWDLGAIAILAGLACVVMDNAEPGQKASKRAALLHDEVEAMRAHEVLLPSNGVDLRDLARPAMRASSSHPGFLSIAKR